MHEVLFKHVEETPFCEWFGKDVVHALNTKERGHEVLEGGGGKGREGKGREGKAYQMNNRS